MMWLPVCLVGAWVLGRLAHRALSGRRLDREGDALDCIAAEMFLGLALALWSALVLAQLGFFSAVTWSAILLAAAVVLLVVGRGRPLLKLGVRWGRRAWLSVALAALLLLGAMSLYWPPFEQIVGGSDPTTYLLWGVRVAREGSWVDHDPLVAGMTDAQVELFFGPGYRAIREHYGSRFLGFYLEDPSTGRVVPQGFPIYPMTVAGGYLVGGIRGALAATPLLALMGVLAVFLLARRLMGPWAGALAAAWLAFSPVQVWYARYASSEIAAQAFLFAGLHAWLLSRSGSRRFPAVVAGFCVGLSLMAHAWMVFVAAALYLLCCADALRHRQRPFSWWFWGPLMVLVTHLLIVASTHAWPYVSDLILSLATSDEMRVGLDFRHFPWEVVAVAVAVLGSSWLLGRWKVLAALIGPATRRASYAVRVLAAVTLVYLAYYGAVVRPETVTWRARSIPQLQAAVGQGGFWLALAGAVLALVASRSWRPETRFTLFLLPAIVAVLHRPLIRPEMMWSLRRYVPVILPAAHILGVLALFLPVVWIARSARARKRQAAGRPRLAYAVVLGLVAGLGLHHAAQLAAQGIELSFVQHRAHSVELVEEMAETVGNDALVILEARSGWRALDYAPALAYWQGLDVLSTFSKQPAEPTYRDFLWRQLRGDRPVHTFSQGFNYYFASPAAIPVRSWVEYLEELETSSDRLPSRIITNRIATNQYILDPARRNLPQAGDSINCGHWDDYFVGEMYAAEHDSREYFRWTEGNGRLWLAGVGGQAARVRLRLGAPDRELGLEREIEFVLDGTLLDTQRVRPGVHEYRVELPADPSRPFAPALQLNVDVFIPAELGDSGDRRWLGVRCYAVSWEPMTE